ncbi:MAG TPA: hypothetical protein PK736_02215 [Bacteroidia bacterium]|nr:hypothetical protein [Bacteroidia bacterium]
MTTQNFNVNAFSFEKQLSVSFNKVHKYFDDDSNNTALSIVALPFDILPAGAFTKSCKETGVYQKLTDF